MVVAYIRSREINSRHMQKKMIEQYVGREELEIAQYYEDIEGVKGVKKSGTVGISCQYIKYPEYERLIQCIKKGDIKMLIADIPSRLYGGHLSTLELREWCEKYKVQIIVLSEIIQEEFELDEENIVAYYCTDKSECRPLVYERQVDEIYSYVMKEKKGIIKKMYLDFSLETSKKTKLQEMIKDVNQYDTILVLAFSHLTRYTTKLLELLKELREKKNTKVESVRQARVRYFQQYDIKRLENINNISAYINEQRSACETIDKKRIELFARNKVDKRICRVYQSEEIKKEVVNDDKFEVQNTLEELLLIINANDVHKDISNYLKIYKKLNINAIYSLEDKGGFIYEN